MRHVYVNRATYILSILLILFTIFFAWLRSNRIVLFVQDTQAMGTHEWFETGAEVFSTSCVSCHAQLEYIPDLFMADNGREYLKTMIVHGVEGPLTIEGEVTTTQHRGFAEFGNDELAAVLNYALVAWGNEEALPDDPDFYEPDEIEDVREEEISPQEVYELRPEL
jgi:mono/diheme cytochrome c family protein